MRPARRDRRQPALRDVAAGFDAATLECRWSREQYHACHPLLFPARANSSRRHDRARMAEVARTGTGSPLQSVLFPAAGGPGVAYLCSFSTITRLEAAGG